MKPTHFRNLSIILSIISLTFMLINSSLELIIMSLCLLTAATSFLAKPILTGWSKWIYLIWVLNATLWFVSYLNI